MFKNDDGFTLIEMLIVLLVISVLIILIIPNLSGKSTEVHDKGCVALVSVVQAQVDAYYLDEGNYPSSLNVLVRKGYITEDQKTCPNQKQLVYSAGKVSAP
ncbi:MAG TPA: competence type IV pilus major pilin ComGC [Bacillota bacterium]